MADDVEGLTSPVRVRYFSGMLLTAEDLEADQTYHRYQRMLHNRYLHGAGVVWGLEVSAFGDGAITVDPGLAVDPSGHEIVVPEPATAQLPDPPGDLPKGMPRVRRGRDGSGAGTDRRRRWCPGFADPRRVSDQRRSDDAGR